MYYASGCSIARFPEDGIVIAKNLKDQGKFLGARGHRDRLAPLPPHLNLVIMVLDRAFQPVKVLIVLHRLRSLEAGNGGGGGRPHPRAVPDAI